MTSEPALRVERVIARLNIGGPAIYTILLTSRLRERGIDTELITGVEAPHEGNMLALAEANGVKPHIIPALGRELSPVRDPAVVFKLYRRFRQTRPHIVDTHTAKAGAVGRTAAWLARVPIRIHTFHGHVFHGYFSPAKTRLFVRLETDLARISTRIVVLGQRQRDEILGLGIGRPEQFEVIPLGLDLTRFYSAEAHAGEDAQRREARQEEAARAGHARQAQQRRCLVESAAGGDRMVHVQLPIAAFEVGAPHAWRLRRSTAGRGGLLRHDQCRGWPVESRHGCTTFR